MKNILTKLLLLTVNIVIFLQATMALSCIAYPDVDSQGIHITVNLDHGDVYFHPVANNATHSNLLFIESEIELEDKEGSYGDISQVAIGNNFYSIGKNLHYSSAKLGYFIKQPKGLNQSLYVLYDSFLI